MPLYAPNALLEYRVELVFKNSPKTKALKNASRDIAKYMNFLLTFDL
jgi:ribosomal protein L29